MMPIICELALIIETRGIASDDHSKIVRRATFNADRSSCAQIQLHDFVCYTVKRYGHCDYYYRLTRTFLTRSFAKIDGARWYIV